MYSFYFLLLDVACNFFVMGLQTGIQLNADIRHPLPFISLCISRAQLLKNAASWGITHTDSYVSCLYKLGIHSTSAKLLICEIEMSFAKYIQT